MEAIFHGEFDGKRRKRVLVKLSASDDFAGGFAV
jgi:hypothetical protein